MKRMWAMAALLLAATAGPGRAEGLAIQSFDATGRLTFSAISTAAVYSVEWAAAPTGEWTTVQAARAPASEFNVDANGMTTRFYRLVAGVTNSLAPEPSGMVLIPGGTNQGTDPDFGSYILVSSAFYMDATAVSKAKWDEVHSWAVTNGYAFDRAGSSKAANHPIQTVNWYDVVKWCNARSQKEGRPAVYTVGGAVYKTGRNNDVVQTSAVGYRLPTDVEWEYAARGGLAGRRFPWGDTITHSQANYVSSSSYSYDTSPTRGYHPTYATGGTPYTSPADAFAPNGYGLHGMAGNVWEWCFDWHPNYVGANRLYRGGSWNFNANYSRTAFRGDLWPDGAYNDIGFRTVLPAQ